MVTYRFFTVGSTGEMLSNSRADHLTDAQARFQAALRLKPGERVEVWRDAICIWEMSARQLAGDWFAAGMSEQSPPRRETGFGLWCDVGEDLNPKPQTR